MKKENRDLLESLIEMKLKESMENAKANPESFEEAMKAIDRQLELDKATKEKYFKYVEIALAVIVTPMIEAGCKHAFAKMICEFEKDYNFTTMAGKSLNSLFKFKK